MTSNVIRDRFQKSRPNSMCDKADMVPADGIGGGLGAAAAPGANNAGTSATTAAAANGAEGESGGKG